MSDDFYKDLVNSIDDYAIFRLDIGGIISSWNPGAEKLKGYKADEIIGKHFSIFYTKEDLKTEKPVRELMQASMVGKYHEQGWRLKKDGSRFWADVTITAIYNKNGKIEGFSKITRDYTKRYLDTQKDKDRYELMLESGNVGTFEWDLVANKMIWSNELNRIFGFREDEEVTDFSQFEATLLEEDRNRVNAAIEESITKGRPYHIQYQIVHRDKSLHWIEAKGKVVRNEKGMPTVFMGVAQNIDLIKANEAVLNIQLKEQTIKLRNAQASLVNAAKMSALGEMAGGIAHEINTPLASITINAQYLERATKDLGIEKLPKVSQNIRETAIKIGRIIKGLRAFARDTQGEEMAEVLLSKLLDDVGNLCANRFKNYGVDLEIRNDDKDLRLKCRPIQIEQVLMNLLNNAFDAVENSSEKKVRLMVRLTEAHLHIKVTDTGHGIKPQNAEKILQPFFTTKPLGKGTGLGLSISKGIVEDHGGRLFLDTQEPKTTFNICLPTSLVIKK